MMIRHFISQALTFCLLSVFTVGANAENTWGSYHWARMENPFTLLVIDSMTTDWDTELNTAITEWSSSEVLNLEVASENDKKNIRKRCPMKDGQIRVCNAQYGFNGWLGLATIGIDSNGHIQLGTAKMNDSYANYWAIEGEKNHVVCQEIGHLFGLGHTSEDGSSQGTCMDYSSDLSSQWPNLHDFVTLAEMYSHEDTFNSYDEGTSDDTGGDGCNAPPGKGCNKNAAEVPPMGVRVYGDRYQEIWVAARRNRGLWIHHIRLAP